MGESDPEQGLARDHGEELDLLAATVNQVSRGAMLAVYQRVEKRALALARRVVGDPALAEDAVQEAFAQLWERSGQISPDGGRLDSLVMTVVHRRAIDLARRRGSRETTLPDPELLQPIDERATAMLERVEETITSEVLRSRLNDSLAALPQEQRTIVRHVYFDELSLPEIAAKEQLPLGTVKSRLRLAMAKLSESIREASR